MDWGAYGTGLASANMRGGLIRNVVHPLPLQAVTHIGVRRGAGAAVAPAAWLQPQMVSAAMSDFMLWNCTANALGVKALTWPPASGAGTEADPATTLRAAIVNSVFERAGTDTSANFWAMGELQYNQMQDLSLIHI